MNIEEIFKGKNITESSAKLYTKNLVRLNDNKPIKNLNFLKNTEKIMDKIKDKAPTTQRSYVISIVSLLKQLNGEQKYKMMYSDYFDILEKMNASLKDRTAKTETEQECWKSNDDIRDIFEKQKEILTEVKGKKKLTEDQHERLLGLVILSLYYLQPPRRNMDYQLMNVVKTYTDDIDTKANYFDVSKRQFVFNQYKTRGKYEKQIIDINRDLIEILAVWLKHHPLKKENDFKLLVRMDGSPLKNNNDITRILNRIFGCKIGTSLLRKMYHTNKYGAVILEMKKDGDAMAHSMDTILSNYIKE